jgi:hypothetical protein
MTTTDRKTIPFSPFAHLIRIEPLSDDEMKAVGGSGLIHQVSDGGSKFGVYRILDVGPGAYHPETGRVVPTRLEKGEIVLVEKQYVRADRVGLEELAFCSPQYVLAHAPAWSVPAKAPGPYSEG